MEHTETRQPETTVALPSRIDDVLAIAQRVSETCDDETFALVFQAAIVVYYRSTYLEPYPVPLR